MWTWSSTGYLYLIDGDGEIIYHPRQQLIYAGLLEENNLAAAGYTDGSHPGDLRRHPPGR